MTIELIQTEHDGTTLYTTKATLDGSDFIFDFAWNDRDIHWFLSLSDENQTPIIGCQSMRIVKGLVLLLGVTDPNRPQGELFILSDESSDPGLYSLGVGADLVYIQKETMDEWRSTV